MSSIPQSLDLASLRRAYSAGTHPEAIINEVYDRIEKRGDDAVWIHRIPRADALEAIRKVARLGTPRDLPLYGVPFAIKDNLDVAGLPTTAACPDFSYTPQETAPTVQRLLDAGAILIGKTNLDQFATGLVGTRSPYGAPSCVFDSAYISGGSSSGSAVAVAAGLVSFALGTDTAGSGRVPAAFNNIVGWKPTRGLLSNRGLVPACRSLDCISVFTLTCHDTAHIMGLVAHFDEEDPFSRRGPATPANLPSAFRFGIPPKDQLEFFGDLEAPRLYEEAIARLERLGGQSVEIDFSIFRETADLLYSGPWVAERLAAVTPFFDEHPDALHPITAKIISGGRRFSAVDTFEAGYRLKALRRAASREWRKMDTLLLPTTGTLYTHAQIEEAPVKHNSDLGFYTNFVNLLDLCGVALPAGFRSNGLPFGVSLFAPAFQDAAICQLAGGLHAALGGSLGGTHVQLSECPQDSAEAIAPPKTIRLAVVGAHLGGQPLNHQLTDRGGVLIETTRTTRDYRLYALADTTPPKPGLVREAGWSGPGIEVEIWSLSLEAFGSFVSEIPEPLGIGTLQLVDGSRVKGFICEPAAILSATEITTFGGWRAFLAKQDSSLSPQQRTDS